LVLADELPSVRYVTSKNGLNQRETPSATSRKIGTLVYGSRVVVLEKSVNSVIIDGITDYWYRCQGGDGFWIFGGYLSSTIPDDTEPVLGYWNTDRGQKYYWHFWPDHTVSTGLKETSGDWRGTWKLCGNKLTITTVPNEFNTGESEILDIIVTVINRDRIYFCFINGNKEYLDRNNNVY